MPELHAPTKFEWALTNTNTSTPNTTMACALDAGQRKYSISDDAGLRSSLSFLLGTRLIL